MNIINSFYEQINQFQNNNKTAIHFNDNHISYHEMYSKIIQCSIFLYKIQKNVTPLTTIAIMAPVSILHTIISLSILNCNFQLIEIPHYFSKYELDNLLTETTPEIIIIDEKLVDNLNPTYKTKTMLIHDFVNNSINSFCEKNYLTNENIHTNSGVVFCTSGSTGKAKCLVKLQPALLECIKNRINNFDLNNNSRALVNEDFSYTMGLLHLYAILFSGGTAILVCSGEDFYKDINQILHNDKITHIYSNPNLLLNCKSQDTYWKNV